ncbi:MULTISPECIES: hypothetical protein [unclassified Corynebacterium]|uniref:hypothetical protein n=1 Tax=unclassified Corynebacterium TaxID=2624378 RepID=UPI0030B50D2E
MTEAVEKHWGDPERSQNREVFDKGEAGTAIVWLCVAALVTLLLEVVYLGQWWTINGVAIPVPWTIPVAYVMNLILTNTALLWTSKRTLAAAPVWCWVAGYLIITAWTSLPFGGDAAYGPWLRAIALLAAGVAGGAWPLRHSR